MPNLNFAELIGPRKRQYYTAMGRYRHSANLEFLVLQESAGVLMPEVRCHIICPLSSVGLRSALRTYWQDTNLF